MTWNGIFRDIGRKQVGESIFLNVQCRSTSKVPTAPDAAPTFRVYSEAAANVINGSLPPIERYASTGYFGYMLRLSSLFAVGRYFVRYQYAISTAIRVPAIDFFEVLAGGNSTGQVISMSYLDRPDLNDFLLIQTDSGATQIKRGPHL